MAVLELIAVCSDCGWRRHANNERHAKALFLAHSCRKEEED